MVQQQPSSASWILAATKALRESGSWTGRIHIHKHLFITQVLGLARPPFEFVLYDYGPYSFELDERLLELELSGDLDRSYPKPGYGPRYQVTLHGMEKANQLARETWDAIAKVAGALGNRTSQSLELVATCLWVTKREGIADDQQAVRKVREIKPKYDEAMVCHALEDAQRLILTLKE